MAKGPEIVITDHQRQAEALERYIDDRLETHQYSQTNHVVYINCPQVTITQLSLDIVRHRFMEAGWLQLEIHYDQHDGNNIVLKYA
jgi:hypothetical protein